jgi:prepilin-type N-terminal cleavage/methylation domain-containing protein
MHGPDSGFTLIEVVASMLVFAIAAVSIVAVLTGALKLTRKNQQRVQAASAAAQVIAADRDAVKNGIAIPDSDTQQIVVGHTTFTVATTAVWTSVGASDSLCTGGVPGEVSYRRIESSVTWADMTGTPAVKTATIATPLDPDKITIPVQLVDSSKTPISGQTITLTPPTGAATTMTTDENGCAIFADLDPQKYTVSVDINGFADATSEAVESHSEQVGQSIPGVIQPVIIFYDRPATLNVVPSLRSGYSLSTYKLPTGFKDTIVQTGWSDGSSHVYSAPINGTALSRSVFPFQVAPGSGYSAYAGGCAVAADSSTTVSTPLGTPAVGALATLSVPVVSGTLKFQTSTTSRGHTTITPLSNATITASDSPDGCSDTYTLQGRTASDGTISFSLPAGDYRFSSGSSSSGTIDVSSTPVNGTVTF